MSCRPVVAYHGVVQDREHLAVVGYDYHCRIVTCPIKRFPQGIDGMLKALAYASQLDGELK